MSKLLIAQGSFFLNGVFREHLEKDNDFDYTLVSTFKEAKKALSLARYEFAVVERTLSDSADGKIIALLNKHNIAPLVFTKSVDEDFFESFESAQIVDYLIKDKFNNVPAVIEKLKQLQQNKKTTVIVVNDSHIYGTYLKQNLKLHNFKVISASNNEEALEKLLYHPDAKLMILEESAPYINAHKLIKQTREDRDLDALNILSIVKETNSFETSNLLDLGANDYIVKEFSRAEFYVRVYQNIK